MLPRTRIASVRSRGYTLLFVSRSCTRCTNVVHVRKLWYKYFFMFFHFSSGLPAHGSRTFYRQEATSSFLCFCIFHFLCSIFTATENWLFNFQGDAVCGLAFIRSCVSVVVCRQLSLSVTTRMCVIAPKRRE